MRKTRITFIGAGNMARALIGGLLANGWDAKQIWATGPHQEKLTVIQHEFGIQINQDNQAGAQAADIIVFAVKPKILKTVAIEIAHVVQKNRPLIISVVTGIKESALQNWLGNDSAIVRCMPNIAALVRCSATALHANPQVTAEQKSWAETILNAVGTTVWLNDENHLDIVTALSGSGPAYFFRTMEILEQTAVAQGLSPATAHLLTLQTVLGTARMALASNEPLTQLRQRVTSPGGTTEQALKILEEGNIHGLFTNALHAAKQRAIELAHSFEE